MKGAESSLTRQVASHLRNQIEIRNLRSGDLISLDATANTLGISVTPVREAVRQLELEGLVKIDSGKGPFVTRILKSEINDLYRLRLTLEVESTRKAALQISEFDVEILQRNVAIYKNSQDKPQKLSKLDRQFHHIIYEASQNKYLESSLKSLRITMGLLRNPAYSDTERTTATLKEHQQILAALEARDPVLASTCASLHIENAWAERIKKEETT